MSLGGEKQQLWNTRLCVFEQAGCCRKGAKCTFAHASHDLKKQPNLVKTSLCFKHLRFASCLKGARCPYAHGAHELRVPPPPHPAEGQPDYEERTRISSDALKRPMDKDVFVEQTSKIDILGKPPGNFKPMDEKQDKSSAQSTSDPSFTRDFSISGLNIALVPVFSSNVSIPQSSHRFPGGGMDGMDPAMCQQMVAMIVGGGGLGSTAGVAPGADPGGGMGGVGGVAFSNVWCQGVIIHQTQRVVEEMLKSAAPDHYDD